MLEHLSLAVVLLDGDLTVLYVNPAAEQLFITSSAHLLGKPLTLLSWDEDSLNALHSAVAEQRPFTRREAKLYAPNTAQIVTMDYTVTPLLNSDKQAQQFLLELQPQERQQRLSREDSIFTAHQATRALVRGVAHEVKNPLGGIRGAAQLLARELPNNELREYTDVIINEADRLSHLVEQMLGSHQRLNLQKINIHQVLERVRLVIQSEVGDAIALERDYDPSLPDVLADLNQLIQVVLNIVRNAAQALLENPSDAPATIWLRTRALRQFTIGSVRHRLVCQIEVEDNGPGISAELLEMLFYPMVTGRAQGTGLGLPIAQGIVQQHGGIIECQSSPGHTQFRILIPFTPQLPPLNGR